MNRSTRLSRRSMLAAMVAAGGVTVAASVGGPSRASAATMRLPGPPDAAKAAEIRTEFLHAWNGYKRFAWGHDEVSPVSGGYSEFFADGHPIGLSIIEALDTHYVMGNDDELARSVAWITQNLSFDIDADFHVFEMIIRVVGGLLAGYLATGNATLLALTVDVTDRLMPAFTQSPTGMPYTHVNLRTGAVSGTTPPIAEVGSNILEFGVLSRVTGDPKYFDAAKKAYRACIAQRSSLNLLASFINVETGQWADSTDAAPNPPDDSFYEYLWGGWEMFRDTDCLNWCRMFTASMKKYMIEKYDGRTWFKQVDFRTGALTGRRQSELAAFYGEVLAHGGDVALGESYYRSWAAVADQYPVLPDEIDYTTFAATAVSNELRPEYLNAAFDLYVQTGKQFYRTSSYQYFQNMKRYNRVAGGYTVVNDVTARPMALGDNFPAYSFAENFKYLYLIFATDTPRYDYATGYLSTEGKILRGMLPAR